MFLNNSIEKHDIKSSPKHYVLKIVPFFISGNYRFLQNKTLLFHMNV
jgi:hypothetical protein